MLIQQGRFQLLGLKRGSDWTQFDIPVMDPYDENAGLLIFVKEK